MSNGEKLHWYCFTFYHSQVTASSYKGFSERDIVTIADINAAKKVADVDVNAVLISLAYLGLMTKEEFANE